jgi:uncharacterized protein with HEPN domain
MESDDIDRIKHMIDTNDEAISFSDGIRKDLSQNRMLFLSLIKEIGIIGEAASKNNYGKILDYYLETKS